MESGSTELTGADVKYSLLRTGEETWQEFWYSIVPQEPKPIADQIREIEIAESELFEFRNVAPESIAARRFFSSDLITHSDEIGKYKARQKSDFFLSVTEQPPANNVKVALMGMCLGNIPANGKTRDGNIICLDTDVGIKHIFVEHLLDCDADEHSDAESQTTKIFNGLEETLSEFGTTTEESVLRTWIFAPHVDADYPGIVKARKVLFDAMNMTEKTHYIASTGIQGGSGNRFARVFMDVYAVVGIQQSNVRYIQAPKHLSPTHVYGVTFERATAVELGKTDFLFISGTASIDSKGEVVHPGDVVKQTERTLKNISALVDSADFQRGDLSSFIVYLRDQADYEFVRPLIEQYCPNLPTVYVRAFACRPGWLIEIEGAAAKVIP